MRRTLAPILFLHLAAACHDSLPQTSSGTVADWLVPASARFADDAGQPLAGCRVQCVAERFQIGDPEFRIVHEDLLSDADGRIVFDAGHSTTYYFLVQEPSGLVTSLGPFQREWLCSEERTIELAALQEIKGVVADSKDDPAAGTKVATFSFDIPHIYWGTLAPAGAWIQEDEDFGWRVEGGVHVGGWAQDVIHFTETGADGRFRIVTRIEEPELFVLDGEGYAHRRELDWKGHDEFPRYASPTMQDHDVRVVDDRHEPIAGASVCVAKVGWGEWGVFQEVGRTSADGTVRARSAGGGVSGVLAMGPEGYGMEWDSLNAVKMDEDESPTVIEREFTLRVQVRDHDGLPISSCRFESLRVEDWKAMRQLGHPLVGIEIANVDEVDPGSYLLPKTWSTRDLILVKRDGYTTEAVDYESDDWARLIRDDAGGVVGDVNLALTTTVSFAVIDASSGQPIAGAAVGVLPRNTAQWSSYERCHCVWRIWAGQAQGITDRHGQWTSQPVCKEIAAAILVEIPAGDQMVVPIAEASSGSVRFRSSVETVTGRVTQAGRPLAGHTLEFMTHHGDEEDATCVTDADGDYSIALRVPALYEISGAPAVDFYMGRYTLVYDAFLEGDSYDVELHDHFLAPQGPTGIVRGRLTDGDEPARGAVSVSVIAADPRDRPHHDQAAGYFAFLDENGAFELTLPAGQLEFWLGYLSPDALPVSQWECELRAGEVIDLAERIGR